MTDANEPSTNISSPSLTLPVHHLLLQAACVIRDDASTPISVTVPAITTVSEALAQSTGSLGRNSFPLFVTPPNSRESARIIRQRLEMSEVKNPIRSIRDHNPDRPLPDFENRREPTEASMARKQRLQDLAMSVIDKDPYTRIIKVDAFESSLMSLPDAHLRLSGVDSCNTSPTCYISGKTIPVLWDTGCHITTISHDTLTTAFREFLELPTYGCKSPDGKIVSVDGILRFSNTDICLQFPARIGALPNGLKGVLLGQIGLIQSLAVRQVPRVFAVSSPSEEEINETVWGDLIVEMYEDGDGEIVKVD